MTKEYTVFYHEDGDDVVINTLEYFKEKGKTYEDVQKKMQENPNWVEKQDKILWTVTKMLEKQKEKISRYEKALHQIDEIMVNVNGD